MGRQSFHTISSFVCEDCGGVMPLPRIHGKQRAKGHIKDVYCPVCKEVKKFKEIAYNSFYKNMDGEIIYK